MVHVNFGFYVIVWFIRCLQGLCPCLTNWCLLAKSPNFIIAEKCQQRASGFSSGWVGTEGKGAVVWQVAKQSHFAAGTLMISSSQHSGKLWCQLGSWSCCFYGCFPALSAFACMTAWRHVRKREPWLKTSGHCELWTEACRLQNWSNKRLLSGLMLGTLQQVYTVGQLMQRRTWPEKLMFSRSECTQSLLWDVCQVAGALHASL